MSSTTTSDSGPSTTSGDLAAGTVVAGFRVERPIGRGSRGTVYEATQLSLGRRVALKLLRDRTLADRVRRLHWPEHPGAVRLFGSGDSEHGPWLAMRLVEGATFATRDAPLDRVAEALDRGHAAGVVHGDVSARNVLVERGQAYLSDFGLGPEAATAADDRAALAALVRVHATRRRRRRFGVAAVATAAAALAVAVTAGGGDEPARVPEVPPGTRPVGSDLAPGDVESVDCAGRPPTGASRACTISQLDLAGKPVVVPTDGVVASWAVRGARGTLALQVLRGRGSRLLEVARSADATIRGPGLRIVPASLSVVAGDRVALLVAPGAAIGVRATGATARTERWVGVLVEPERPPDRGAGTGLDRELLLRVDIRPGGGPPVVEALRGDRAALATGGRRIARREVPVAGGRGRIVRVVVVGGAVAVDAFEGARRVTRDPVPGADGRGRLVSATPARRALRVRWRNPDGRTIDRRVAAG